MIMKRKFLTLQIKIMLAIVFVALAFCAVFLFLYISKNEREDQMKEMIISTNLKAIHSTLNNNVSFQRRIVDDYATWDAMHRYVQQHDMKHLRLNGQFIMENYHQDYVAIFDAEGNCLFGLLDGRPLFSSMSVNKLNGDKGDFFLYEDTMLIHVTWSRMCDFSSAADPASCGYIFIGKRWDTALLASLSTTTGLQLSISYPGDTLDSALEVGYDLRGIDNQILASLYYVPDDFIDQLHAKGESLFVIVLIAVPLILLAFWFIIRGYVMRPISMIMRFLHTDDETHLQPIKLSAISDEWGSVASLIEEHHKDAKQLHQLLATKDKFFDLVAHDMRSPFNGILGFADLLIEEDEIMDPKDRKTYLRYIQQAGKTAVNLLSMFQEWARLQTGRWVPDPHAFLIHKLVKSVVLFHQANALSNHINLSSDVDVSLSAYADDHMIETVIRNLVSNAIKFTPAEGQVTICAKKHDDAILVTVSDTGKGMSPDLVKSLFKVGENVVSADVSGNVGTGLGLLLCHELVTQNGGAIWVESELGKGSQFHFTVPLEK